MRNKILIPLFLLISAIGFGQQKVTWDDLAKVKFEEKYLKELNELVLYPTFSDAVKGLEGKMLTITGYFLNVDPEGKMYVLSKNPMASCFFCGGGGPETAIELQFPSKQNIKTDAIVTVSGKFKLNKDDINHFNYILTDCKAILIK